MPEVAIVTDTTHYMPRELVERDGIHEVSLYVNDGATPRARVRHAGLRRVLRAPARRRPAADDVAAVDRRLPRGLRAARRGRATTSSRSTSRGGISGTVESARQAAAELSTREPQRPRSRSSTRAAPAAGIGLMRARRRSRARGGGDVDAVAARVARPRDEPRSGSRSTRSSSCAAAAASAPRRPGSAAR